VVADEDVQDAYLHVVEFDTPEEVKGYAQGIGDSLVNGKIAVSGSIVAGALMASDLGHQADDLYRRSVLVGAPASKVDIEAKTPGRL